MKLSPAMARLLLMLIILFISFNLPYPSATAYALLKIILGVAVVGFAAIIPGTFNLRINRQVTAGGALVIFAFTFVEAPKAMGTNCKCCGPISYTIYKKGASGVSPLVNKGQVKTETMGLPQSRNIDGYGTVGFEQIPGQLYSPEAVVQIIAGDIARHILCLPLPHSMQRRGAAFISHILLRAQTTKNPYETWDHAAVYISVHWLFPTDKRGR